MIETNNYSTHLAGIIPVAGTPLDFNMPWSDCLMPVHQDYHAIERAIHSAAMAGCNTIWVVLYRESQPIIKKKIGEWVYDPESVWKAPNVFFNKIEIPVYYVCINPRDRQRRDSQAWSALYGAKVASYVSMKISKWVIPKRFFVISPYGVIDEECLRSARSVLRGTQNVVFSLSEKTFLDNEYLPFTFSQKEFEDCRRLFKERYTGDETKKTFSEVFEPVDLSFYTKIEPNWFYNISTWDGYSKFIGSEHNKLCSKPKYMVTHEWWGFVKDV